MKTIFDHLEYIKKKPHHVRKRIAFGTATAGTAFVTLIWFVSALGSNTFAIKESSFAKNIGQESIVVTGGIQGNHPANSGIAGAAAALSSASGPAHIEIIDTASSTRKVEQIEQTTIPF